MNVLLKQATIIAPHTAYHKQVNDILITDGIIAQIGTHIETNNASVIEGNQLHVSIGWCDIFADFGTPGFEHRETFETGAAAAAAGGFTDVMLLPDTNPVIDNQSMVSFIQQSTAHLPVNIVPIGAVTKNSAGTELSEMYDMHQHGAVAFSDGKKSIQQAGILLKALQYVQAKNATIIQIPNDKSISDGGLINEGIMSTQLGLPGIPAIAEVVMINRDIELLKYTQSRLHFTGISTQQSVQIIKAAKAQGLQVTCSVTPYHLTFSDEDVVSYNTNLKVHPPLRTKADVMALQNALQEGVIDGIASHHSPQTWDDKVCEFEYAKNGMLTLQTVFGSIHKVWQNVEALVQILTVKNRLIFNLPIPTFAIGEKACITIFEPNTSYVFTEKDIVSASKNSAYINQTLTGKVVGIINKNKVIINTN
ncbi:dihydroorotase family protein [Ferruginibacter yonginensis]|uniref:Dihydroorotase family protein n=1 Tax=Ferruginibacter yonginensis TaxID=1310416 RepID=A0ABV8QM32_9BACT